MVFQREKARSPDPEPKYRPEQAEPPGGPVRNPPSPPGGTVDIAVELSGSASGDRAGMTACNYDVGFLKRNFWRPANFPAIPECQFPKWIV